MRARYLRWLLTTALVALCHAAQAHGVAGNRVFPGTLAFDDPAVLDELIFPALSSLNHPDDSTNVIDNRIGWSFARLLTPTLAIEINSGWIHRNWGPAQRSGFDITEIGLKGLLYKNGVHEMLISAGLVGDWRFRRGRRGRKRAEYPSAEHLLRKGIWRSAS